ncbi:MAG: sigma-70 family RNA polymerase sigma factor [Chloroflexi bacterium]|nr:sigma-70 family RNA polymerase sigma factor [Chloroflexota bacterium]MBV9598543.1 sigma-70 family RNA polymerase sigma factor [Chloroflexota bacterium]
MSDDLALASRLAGDVDSHFEELVRTFQDRLYGFALRLTGDPADAEECTQDSFVRAYRALQRYPSDRVRALRLKAWLYQITLNVVRNRARRAELPRVNLDRPDVANGLTAQRGDEQPELASVLVETRSQLATAISRLPERYAAAVVLRHVQGLSYAEAAEILDQPVGTTKSDVHRGLGLLREALEKPEFKPLLVGDHR